MKQHALTAFVLSISMCGEALASDEATELADLLALLEKPSATRLERAPLHCGTWEAGDIVHQSHFDQMSVDAFHATRPTTPQRMYVFAQLDDHFGGRFHDQQDTMLSVQLLSFEEHAMGWAYVDRHSATGQRLYERLKNSSYHKLVADFSYPPDAESAGYFMLDELWVTDTWVISN